MISRQQLATLVERFGVGSQLTGGVLLVDDEPLNLRVLKDLLEERWTVHQATSGAEALRIAAAVPLDVVVTDQRMPGMSGVELLAALRELRPDLAGIVITGFADMQALESAINRAHAFRFLRKPWESDDVIQAVEQASALVAQGRTIAQLVQLLAARGEELKASLRTLQDQQQQLLHLERVGTLGRLASGIAHDLKNVMTGLRSAEAELQALDVDPDLRSFLALGLAHVDSLLRTLQTLRDFSRSGSLELVAGLVEPAQLVETSVAICRLDLSYRMRRVVPRVAPGLPLLRADGQKLIQVLVNLVRNALQASEDGGEVRISAEALPEGGLLLAVEDDGPGVPEALRARLFQPFATGRGEQGLGMGLYMARLIAETHGGRIAVGSGQRGGARFEVVLPSNGPVEGPPVDEERPHGPARAG
ncbi:MAG: hybrid sensor histidine kinase/response regulator [Anaeromyxobacter sp.]|nr:hybrid sensor histidine kinase/response regulator [Anaeromyxobacter sp.]MBL0278407.1 hybrid sensor histidine kinase/response regulator [Anaeromyxobacter sp.]